MYLCVEALLTVVNPLQQAALGRKQGQLGDAGVKPRFNTKKYLCYVTVQLALPMSLDTIHS